MIIPSGLAMKYAERFHGRHTVGDGCHEWTHSVDKDGYGIFTVGTRGRRAHRVAWELANGEIGAGLCVCHTCDNPKCVRVSHLFLGSNDENVADRHAKNRSASGPKMHARRNTAKGERAAKAKLTADQVVDIRARSAAGESGVSLARSFGVSPTAITYILQRRHWRHV